MLYPTDEEAGYPEPPVCPLCHQRCDTIYRTDDGTIVGCDRCLEAADAWDGEGKATSRAETHRYAKAKKSNCNAKKFIYA